MPYAHSLLLAAVCCLAGSSALAGSPVIYWQCDPVGPDETLMLFGDSLGPQARILAAPLDDVEPGTPEAAGKPRAAKEQELKALQADPQCIKLLVPASWRWGCYRVQLQTPRGTTQVLVNRPEVWWFLGDAGPAVSPGGECRLFGKNLWLGPTTGTWPGRVMLRTTAGRFQQLPVLAANRYAVTVRLPADLPAGRYSVWLHHGHGGPAGWSAPVEITVQPAPSWPSTLYNVRDFGAKGDGLTDDTAALRAALGRCQKEGGGIVFLPRGTYKISGTLVIPRRTVLRGERREWVWLYVPQKTPEFNTVLAGKGEFGVEELSLVAQTPRRLITAPDVPTMYNMPWGAPAVHGQPLPRADDVRLHRLRLHHLRYAHRVGPKDPRRCEHSGPSTVALCGQRLEISDCEIVSSGMPIILHDIRYSRILRNHLHTGRAGWYGIWGARQTVIEGNLIEGRDLEASYGGFGNYLDYMDDKGVLSTDLAQLYIAENRLQNGFGCERESLAFDSPGNFPWVGPVASADAKSLQAAGVKWRPDAFRGLACLIVTGRGLGQHRRIIANSAERLEVDAPWDVPPDHTSIAAITAYRRDVVIYHNQVQDASAAVELWGGGYNFLIEANTSVRTGGLWGRAVQYKAHGQHVFLPCYFTQWLNNDIREGFVYEQGPEADQSAVLGLYSQTPPAIAAGLPVLGNVIRGNRLADRTRIGLLHYGAIHMAAARDAYRKNTPPPPAGRDTVIEGNSLSETPVGIEIGPGFYGTVVRTNRFQHVSEETRDWKEAEARRQQRKTQLRASRQPLGHWNFDQLRGGCVPDQSGNGFDLHIEGQVKLVPGVSGQAVQFDGRSWLRLDSEDAWFFNLPSFTVALWINPEEIRGRSGLLVKRFSNTVAPLILSMTEGTLAFEAANSAEQWTFNVHAPGAVQPGQWQHLAVVVEQGKGVTLYRNGIQIAHRRVADKLCDNEEPLVLGREAWGGRPPTNNTPGFYAGRMDEVVIWARPLSTEAIQQLAKKRVPPQRKSDRK